MRGSFRVIATLAVAAVTAAGCSGSTTKTAASEPIVKATTSSTAPKPTTTKAATAKAATTTTVVKAPTTFAPVTTPFDVASREETYVDATRPTAANGDYTGAPTRTIRTVFLYPEIDGKPAPGPFPLFLFSHGHGGSPEAYKELLQRVAEQGYVVVAPSYPLSNGAAPGGATLADVPNQPADASFVLGQALAEPFMQDLADAEHIGTGGHSLGGITTYGLVYNSCCRDPRIDAAIAVAGAAVGGYPQESFFTGINTPLLAIHGANDDTVSYTAGREAWDRAQRPKYLLTFLDGGHNIRSDKEFDATADAFVAFLDAQLKGDPNAMRELERVGNEPGYTTLDALS